MRFSDNVYKNDLLSFLSTLSDNQVLSSSIDLNKLKKY